MVGVSTGILSSVGSAVLDELISYKPEIETFQKDRPEFLLTSVNLERQFKAAISHIACRSFPFIFLLGKDYTGILRLISDLTNNMKSPGSGELSEQSAVGQKKVLDHGIIGRIDFPNLSTPKKPYCIEYIDGDLEQDVVVGEHFCADISDIINSYFLENENTVKLSFKENTFRKYLFDLINSLYVEIYGQLSGSSVSSARISPDYQVTFKNDPEKQEDTGRIRKKINRAISSFKKDIARCEVARKPPEEIQAIIKEELEKYESIVLSDLEKPELEYTPKEISEKLLKSEKRGKITGISMEPLNDLVEKLGSVRQGYSEEKCSPKQKDWIDTIIGYFMANKGELERAAIAFMNERRKCKDAKPSFSLKHGDYVIPIEVIMQPNVNRPTVDSLYNEINEFNQDALFGTFRDPSVEVPPHMVLSSVGTFFQGSAVLLPNNASAFINAMIKKKEEEKEPFIETFLSSMRKGRFTITYKGISFQFAAPSIIIGGDSVNPFENAEQLQKKLEERIKIIEIPSNVENTVMARQGTMKVIYDTIEDFNNLHKKKISFSNDVVDCLLQKEIALSPSISTDYGKLTEKITQILGFAAQKGYKEVNLQKLKEYRLFLAPEDMMEKIDRDLISNGGWKKLKIDKEGFVNGLAVVQLDIPSSETIYSGLRFPISSYVKPSKREREKFIFHDAKQGMASSDAKKGYDLAIDYITKHFDLNAIAGQIKTEVYENTEEFEGNSASLAIALSILSAVSNTKIYKNRFITGTLQAEDGSIGQIGGIVEKATVPSRIYEKMEEKEPLYLIFPSGNARELAEGLLDDPYGIADNVTCLPVNTFEAAWYLATCGPVIEQGHLEDIDKKAKAHFQTTLEKISAKKN